LKKKKYLRDYFQALAEDPIFNGRDLCSLLIAPIQRIPRYVLLLQDLLKATPEYHVEYAGLCKAVNKLKETADAINTKAREAEQMAKVYEIQSQLIGENVPNLVRPHRRFIREGDLRVIGETSVTRLVLLFNDLLVVCTRVAPQKIQLLQTIGLRHAGVRALPDQPPSKCAQVMCKELFFFGQLVIV
jgi:hypothetical protein